MVRRSLDLAKLRRLLLRLLPGRLDVFVRDLGNRDRLPDAAFLLVIDADDDVQITFGADLGFEVAEWHAGLGGERHGTRSAAWQRELGRLKHLLVEDLGQRSSRAPFFKGIRIAVALGILLGKALAIARVADLGGDALGGLAALDRGQFVADPRVEFAVPGEPLVWIRFAKVFLPPGPRLVAPLLGSFRDFLGRLARFLAVVDHRIESGHRCWGGYRRLRAGIRRRRLRGRGRWAGLRPFGRFGFARLCFWGGRHRGFRRRPKLLQPRSVDDFLGRPFPIVAEVNVPVLGGENEIFEEVAHRQLTDKNPLGLSLLVPVRLVPQEG